MTAADRGTLPAELAVASPIKGQTRRRLVAGHLSRRVRGAVLNVVDAMAASARGYFDTASALRMLIHLTIAISLLFLIAPRLDIAASALFAGIDGGFPLTENHGLRMLRALSRWLTIVIISALAASLVLSALAVLPDRVLRPHKALFVLAVYALGPGLLVNLILKETVGRARPREIAEFGGTLDFSAIWQVSDACQANCSFTSGEGASAAAMLALALLVPKAWRSATFAMIAVPAVAFSVSRVAFGGHFVSDVILSWLLVGIVMVLIRPYFFGASAATIDEAVMGAAAGLRRLPAQIVGRLGQAVRRARNAPAEPPAGISA